MLSPGPGTLAPALLSLHPLLPGISDISQLPAPKAPACFSCLRPGPLSSRPACSASPVDASLALTHAAPPYPLSTPIAGEAGHPSEERTAEQRHVCSRAQSLMPGSAPGPEVSVQGRREGPGKAVTRDSLVRAAPCSSPLAPSEGRENFVQRGSGSGPAPAQYKSYLKQRDLQLVLRLFFQDIKPWSMGSSVAYHQINSLYL